MAWKSGPNTPLGQSVAGTIDAANTTQVGMTTIMVDDITGQVGEFIYLPGVAALVAGDAVVYDLTPGAQSVTRLANNAQNNTGRPVAFASAAILAGQFGWYQIGGLAVINTVAGVVAGVMMATATTGQVGNTADTGDQILNARILSAVGTPAAGKSYAQMQRPFMQGQIT